MFKAIIQTDQEYRTVVLGGLLHDIGKLLQRGSFGHLEAKGKHPVWSATFVEAFKEIFSQITDVQLLKLLVQKHHESQYFPPDLNVNSIENDRQRTLASLVSLADNLSSGERGEHFHDMQDYKEVPLASVLERVNNTWMTIPNVHFHAGPLLKPEEMSSFFPDKGSINIGKEITGLNKSFGKEFEIVFKSGTMPVDNNDFDCVLAHMYRLLLKYAWCLPSDTQEVFADISLFDHLRTTAAIASCLYLYHTDNGNLNEKIVRNTEASRFLLVTGDISGIQNYIFDIASTGAGGIARRLRARSFYVQMCSEIASHLILHNLGLPIMIHTIMNSGGHFYMLLPNIDSVRKSIADSQKEIDDWFLHELNGELALNLAAIPFNNYGFQMSDQTGVGFGSVIKNVNEQLDGKKKSRFTSILQQDTQWRESNFILPTKFEGENSCVSCRKFPQVQDGLCNNCIMDREVGKELPEVRYIAFYKDKTSGIIPILNRSVTITAGRDDVKACV